MSDENLRKMLEQLHDELERTESVDETGDELLRHLNEDIRSLLQRSGRAEVQAECRRSFRSHASHAHHSAL